MQDFNYDNNQEMPLTGAPIFVDDLANMDYKMNKTFKAIINALRNKGKLTNSLSNQLIPDNSNMIIYGCDGTLVNISSNDYTYSITEGLIMVDNNIVEVDAQSINLTHDFNAYSNKQMFINITTTNHPRLYQGGSTNVTLIRRKGNLSLSSSSDVFRFNISLDPNMAKTTLVNSIYMNQTIYSIKDSELPAVYQPACWELFGTNNIVSFKPNNYLSFNLKFKIVDTYNLNEQLIKLPYYVDPKYAKDNNWLMPVIIKKANSKIYSDAYVYFDSTTNLCVSKVEGGSYWTTGDIVYINTYLTTDNTNNKF